MRVDLALLADYATADQMDKLVLAGVFRALFARSIPFKHPTMFLALTITIEGDDQGDHDVTVRLIDPNGHNVIPDLQAELKVDRVDPGRDSAVNLILGMNNVEFQSSGTHCFDIFLDGRFMDRVPLEVALIRAAPES
jgi:hypothetical protein